MTMLDDDSDDQGSMFEQDPYESPERDPHAPLRQDPRKTRISRVLLTQEIAMFLPPAPYGRKVQIMIPQGTIIYIDEDRPVELNDDGTAPDGFVARNRNYWLPPFESGQVIEFSLCEGQWLVGCTEIGTVAVCMTVEPRG